jgi:hypothetical protein
VATLDILTDMALREKRIAYVAAYGDHKAKLAVQRLTPNKLIQMRHKWGFATTRRQWAEQRELLNPYLEIVSRNDYRSRDHRAIRTYFDKLGYGSTGTSQDAMKDVASHVLGTTKIMTFVCLAKYIGEIGLHSKRDIYDEEGFAHTEIYPDKLSSFEHPSSKQLDEWIAVGRTNGKKAVTLAKANAVEETDRTRDTSVGVEEKFARALYRVFLLREPDAIGLASVLRQLRSGRSFEEVMRWCLSSEEFAQKHRQFMRTYLSPEFLRSVAADADAPSVNGNLRRQSSAKAKR